MQIHRLNKQHDLGAVAALIVENKGLSVPEATQILQDILTVEAGFPACYWAQQDGQAVGMLVAAPWAEGPLGIKDQIWLTRLYVKPDYRGQAIAQQLMDQAIAQALGLGYGDVYLDTAQTRGYYDKLGWDYLGEDWWEEGGMPIYVFKNPQNQMKIVSQEGL